LPMLFGALLQLSFYPRFPKRIYRLGFDSVLEFFKEFADGNAR
jgi:hypothetical protein